MNNGNVANLKPWPPGVSGNPSGRPKSLALHIRQQTENGRELVDILLSAARGREDDLRWGERLKAIEMLLDRGGFPKVIAEPGIDIPDVVGNDLMGQLTDEEIIVLVRARARLNLLARPSPGPGTATPEPPQNTNGEHPPTQ